MRRTTAIILTIAFVGALSLTFTMAESYTFETRAITKVADVDLEPGRYQLQLNSTKTSADIYDGKRLVVRAKVSVSKLQDELPSSLRTNRHGEVVEFRSRTEKIVFLTEKSGKTLASTETH